MADLGAVSPMGDMFSAYQPAGSVDTGYVVRPLFDSAVQFLLYDSDLGNASYDLPLTSPSGLPSAGNAKPTFSGIGSLGYPTTTTLLVTWGAASDDTTASASIVYRIYVTAGGGALAYSLPYAVSAAGATNVTLTGLLPDVLYRVGVRAVDQDGAEDTNVVSLTATTSADTAPPIFSGVAAALAASTGIRLSWNVATDDFGTADSIVYRVYRSTTSGGQNFATPLATTSAGSTTYLDTTATAGVRYYYVVRAVDPTGNVETNTTEVDARISVTKYRMQGIDVDALPPTPRCWTVEGTPDDTGALYATSPNTGAKSGTSPLEGINIMSRWVV